MEEFLDNLRTVAGRHLAGDLLQFASVGDARSVGESVMEISLGMALFRVCLSQISSKHLALTPSKAKEIFPIEFYCGKPSLDYVQYIFMKNHLTLMFFITSSGFEFKNIRPNTVIFTKINEKLGIKK